MSTENTVRQITRRETLGSIRLWFAVLVPPLAWATQLMVNYSLEEWFACSPSVQEEGEILGASVDAWALTVSSVLTLISLSGLIVAIGCHRRLRGSDGADAHQRARWMALAGILNGILYTAIIAASYAVPLMLGSCRTP